MQSLLGRSSLQLVSFDEKTKKRKCYKAILPSSSKKTFTLFDLDNKSNKISAECCKERTHYKIIIPSASISKDSKFYLRLEQQFGPSEETDSFYIEQKELQKKTKNIIALIPCYNVEPFCKDVIEKALLHAEKIVVVNDGSTDKTAAILSELKAKFPDQIHIVSHPKNLGKGSSLIDGFKYIDSHFEYDVIVTLDSDKQHDPNDIPRLAQAILDGEDLTIGARTFEEMPLKNRIANYLISISLKTVFPTSPRDTQSGFRAFSKKLIKQLIQKSFHGHYEMEFNCLLYALSEGNHVRSLPISTIYIDGNRSSHFSTIKDSFKIIKVLIKYAKQKSFKK